MNHNDLFTQSPCRSSLELRETNGESLLNTSYLEDRLDSDIEADIQQASVCSEITVSDGDKLSTSSAEAFGISDRSTHSSFSSICGSKQSTFFRRALLSGVSSQLHNFSSRADVGSPTCLSFLRYLVIGTTKGIIFVFNVHQVLRFCFGAEQLTSGKGTKFGESHGSVTALSQNVNGSHVLSGYTSGRIAVWGLHSMKSVADPQERTVRGKLDEDSTEQSPVHVDNGEGSGQARISSSAPKRPISATNNSSERVSGRLLFVVDDAHGAGQAIAMCSFTTISSLSVCVDTGGSAFQLHFKRGLTTGIRKESACFFSGSRGEICGLEPLTFSPAYADHQPDCSASHTTMERCKFLEGSLGCAALVAMASFTKLIIVRLRPRIQIVYWRPFKGPPACLPLLTWQWDYRMCTCRSSSFAILAFGRGSSLHLLKVSSNITDEGTRSAIGIDRDVIKFELLHSIELKYILMSLKWLSAENRLVTLDVSETLHLVDSSSGEDIESLDVSSLHLVYHKELFRSAAAGGSVSEALEAAGQRACTYSVAAYDSQLLLLVQTGVYLFTLRTWPQLVKSLFIHYEVDVALLHCVTAVRIEGSQFSSSPPELSPFRLPSITVVHIPPNRMPREKLEREILSLLRQHVLPLLTVERQDVWKLTPEGVETVLEIASLLSLSEFVISELFPLLEPVVEWRSWFFVAFLKLIHTLRPFGQLTAFDTANGLPSGSAYKDMCYNLRPDITRGLLDWCLDPTHEAYRSILDHCITPSQSVGQYWAEACILKLPPTTLDLDQCVKLCWNNRLYSAYLHLCTDILLDFETPFKALYNHLVRCELPESTNSGPCLSDDECVHHLLILVRLGLAAESCSHDTLPSSMTEVVPKQIFDLLLKGSLSAQYDSTSPRPLAFLLEHNSVDFLNLLTLSTSADAFFRDESSGPLRRSRLYRELIACSLEFADSPSVDSKDTPFPVHVFVFIAHQLTSEADPKKMIDLTLLLKLYSLICSESKMLLRRNSLPFESAVTDLITHKCLTDLDTCLFLAQRAQCYYVCEYIHRIRNETFEAFRDQLTAMQCSLPPCPDFVLLSTCPVNRAEVESYPAGTRVFSFLEFLFSVREPEEKTLHSLNLSREDLSNVKALCLEKLSVLARYDAERTLRLLTHIFDLSISELLSQLSVSFNRYNAGMYGASTDDDQSSKLPCFLLLRTFFQCRHNLISQSDLSDDGSVLADTQYKSWESFLSTSSSKVAGFFVHLLVESGAPESELLHFLTTNRDYDAISLLQTVSSEVHPRVLAYLYEQLGELDKALETHEQSFIRNWKSLTREYDTSVVELTDSSSPDKRNTHEAIQIASLQQHRTMVHTVADNWFSFCQRYHCSQKGAANNVWFRVIDVLMQEQSLVSASLLVSELNEIFHNLLSFVTPNLSLTTIVSYILQKQSSHNSVKFSSKTNAFITRLVTTCQYETEQTALNKKLARRDLTRQQLAFLAQFRQGCNVKHSWCGLCAHRLRYQPSSDRICSESNGCTKPSVLLFRCSHIFHFACVDANRRASLMKTRQPDQRSDLMCPLCSANMDENANSETLLGRRYYAVNGCRPLVNHINDSIRVDVVGNDVVPMNPFDK